ncbi:MAG: hypothetical protein J0M18_13595 [Ignavibacteria bacterium]|nr:hypothetical protein [Ignavibacteria bacterium]
MAGIITIIIEEEEENPEKGKVTNSFIKDFQSLLKDKNFESKFRRLLQGQRMLFKDTFFEDLQSLLLEKTFQAKFNELLTEYGFELDRKFIGKIDDVNLYEFNTIHTKIINS